MIFSMRLGDDFIMASFFRATFQNSNIPISLTSLALSLRNSVTTSLSL